MSISSPEIKACEGEGRLVDIAKKFFDAAGVNYETIKVPAPEPGGRTEHLFRNMRDSEGHRIDDVEDGSLVLDSGKCKIIIEELTATCGYSIRVHCPSGVKVYDDFTPRLISIERVFGGKFPDNFGIVILAQGEYNNKGTARIHARRSDSEGGNVSAEFKASNPEATGTLQLDRKCTGKYPHPLECKAHSWNI